MSRNTFSDSSKYFDVLKMPTTVVTNGKFAAAKAS